MEAGRTGLSEAEPAVPRVPHFTVERGPDPVWASAVLLLLPGPGNLPQMFEESDNIQPRASLVMGKKPSFLSFVAFSVLYHILEHFVQLCNH